MISIHPNTASGSGLSLPAACLSPSGDGRQAPAAPAGALGSGPFVAVAPSPEPSAHSHRGFETGCSLLAHRRGFTLVELLVTTSLLALVGGAAVAALAGGLRVWNRASEFGTQQQATLIALQRMRNDLQSFRHFHFIHFDGVYNEYAYPAVGQEQPEADGIAEIGRVGFFLDEHQHVLCRSFVPYRRIRQVRVTDRCQAILEDVTRLRFAYFGRQADGTVRWADQWDATSPPLAVKWDLTLQEGRKPATTQTSIVFFGSDEAKTAEGSTP